MSNIMRTLLTNWFVPFDTFAESIVLVSAPRWTSLRASDGVVFL